MADRLGADGGGEGGAGEDQRDVERLGVEGVGVAPGAALAEFLAVIGGDDDLGGPIPGGEEARDLIIYRQQALIVLPLQELQPAGLQRVLEVVLIHAVVEVFGVGGPVKARLIAWGRGVGVVDVVEVEEDEGGPSVERLAPGDRLIDHLSGADAVVEVLGAADLVVLEALEAAIEAELPRDIDRRRQPERAPARRLERRGQPGQIGGDAAVVLDDAVGGRPLAGEHGDVRGQRPGRGRGGGGEPGPGCRQLVDRRGGRQVVAVGAEVIAAQGVDADQEDVGLVGIASGQVAATAEEERQAERLDRRG